MKLKKVIPQNVLDDVIERGFYLSDNMEHAYSPIGVDGSKLYYITIGDYQMEIADRRVWVTVYYDYNYLPITKDKWNEGTRKLSDKMSNIKKLINKL